jgi:hypothetical protein
VSGDGAIPAQCGSLQGVCGAGGTLRAHAPGANALGKHVARPDAHCAGT